jgi:hypothetical protein
MVLLIGVLALLFGALTVIAAFWVLFALLREGQKRIKDGHTRAEEREERWYPLR